MTSNQSGILSLAIASAVIVILLGSILIPAIDEATDIYAESGDTIDVYIITGQSNSGYFNYNVSVANEELPHIGQDKAYYYGTSSMPPQYGLPPSTITPDPTYASYDIYDMVDSSGNFIIGGNEAPFASKYVNETGRRVALINTGIGGQSITDMQPGQVGNTYNQEVISHAYADLEAKGFKINACALLFFQGETDANMSISEYKAYFKTMLASYLEESGCKSCIISQVRPYNAPNPAEAQEELAKELSNVYMGSTASSTFTIENGRMLSDNVHYSQYGKDIIGPQLAETAISVEFPTAHMMEKLSPILSVIPVIIIAVLLLGAVAILVRRD